MPDSVVRSNALTLLVLAIVTMLLLAPFLPQELVRDSAGWGSLVNTGSHNMWHPHHLIYMPINWVFLQIVTPFCSQCDAIQAGQIHSILWAVVMVLSTYSLIRHLTGLPLLSAMLSLLLLVSHSVWVLALQPQAYIPLLGVISLLFAFLIITKNHTYSWKWLFAASLLYSLAVLFHQAMVLLCFPLAYYIIKTKGGSGVKNAAIILSLSGVIVLFLYFWATQHVMGELTTSTFIEYITTFSQVMTDPGYFNFGNYSIANLAILLNSQLSAVTIAPWNIRDQLQYIFNIGIAGVFFWNILQAKANAINHKERVFLLVTIFVFGALTLWGNPADDGWPSFILFPLVVLLGITLADLLSAIDRMRHWKTIFAIFLAVPISLIAIRNFNEKIHPMHVDKGVHYRYSKQMALTIPSDCIIYEIEQLRYYSLQYYFSRYTRDYWDHITAAYYGGNKDLNNFFGKKNIGKCIALDTSYINPDFRVIRNTGWQLSAQWLYNVAWMFDLAHDSGGQFSWREFTVAPAENGRSYFIIQPQRIASGSIHQFLQSIIIDAEAGEIGTSKTYEQWKNAFCGKSERGVVSTNLTKNICFGTGT